MPRPARIGSKSFLSSSTIAPIVGSASMLIFQPSGASGDPALPALSSMKRSPIRFSPRTFARESCLTYLAYSSNTLTLTPTSCGPTNSIDSTLPMRKPLRRTAIPCWSPSLVSAVIR